MSDTGTAGKTGRSHRLLLAIAVVVGIAIGAGGYAAVSGSGSASVGGGSDPAACARVTELEKRVQTLTQNGPGVAAQQQQYQNTFEATLAELTSARQKCPG